MAEEKLIGLAELIKQVKRELLPVTSDQQATSDQETEVPLLSVDTIELELQVTVRDEGKVGLKLYVFEAGGGGSRDDVQKVKVTLSPLLNKEMRLRLLHKKLRPEQWRELLEQNVEALTKGSDGHLGDEY